ncbi:MAG: DUF4474 domain-containing protein [Oscillospiraceae bacterium]|jgi:hypothetical protein|nr:DUF4474 domain-containing protein [Oscillospiraceae bacterium]
MILHVLHIVVASLLSFVTAFSSVGAAAEKPGVKAFDSAAYAKEFNRSLKVYTLGLFPSDTLHFTYDETMQALFDQLEENSGFSFQETAAVLPDVFQYLRWLYALTPEQFNAARDELLARAETYGNEDNAAMMVICRILGISVAQPAEIHFYADPKSAAGEYRVMFRLTYADGSVRTMDSGVSYDANNGLINQGTSGIASTGFDMDVKNAWLGSSYSPQLQRYLGYSKLYDDMLLQTTDMVNVTTVRLKFAYKGKDWMLQLWKGRYFITSGGEVGLYNKPANRAVDFYDCAADTERIPMSFRLTGHDDGSSTVLIDRPVTLHWWMMGFAVREYLYTPERLTLETEITPTDDEMKVALTAALDKEVQAGTLSYTASADGNALHITW